MEEQQKQVIDLVQKDAVGSLLDKDKDVLSGTLLMGTGTGKTKVAIDTIKALGKYLEGTPRVLWVTPTERLRDVDAPAEFDKWKAKDEKENTTFICYSSLTKLRGEEFDLCIFDECHHITENNIQFIFNNDIKRLVCVTATFPEDEVKAELIQRLAPIRFTYSIEDAIDDEIVKKVNIHVCYTSLEDETKDIEVKTKDHHFWTTEKRQYEYYTKEVEKYKHVYFSDPTEKKKQLWFGKIGRRSNFIYNLPSKIRAAKKFLLTLPDDEPVLVYGKRIDAINQLDMGTFHSKKKDSSDLDAFCSGESKRLAVVDGLNEGANLPHLKTIVVMSLDSKKLNLTQRVGRAVRKDGDQEANVYIFVSKGTQDEVWFRKAIQAFQRTTINYFNIQ